MVRTQSELIPCDGKRLYLSATSPWRRARAFTLLELMIVLAVAGLLSAFAIPSYRDILEKQKIGQCVRDLTRIAGQLEKYRTLNGRLPDTLLEVNLQDLKDPWGAGYDYLNFNSKDPGVAGKIRKDHNLHPLNTEFDLYSRGPDGKSNAALTAAASRDDVIWARDGGFIGSAKDF